MLNMIENMICLRFKFCFKQSATKRINYICTLLKKN